jgi:ApbE superfamily uncharacterized protein (UPF0280 family)
MSPVRFEFLMKTAAYQRRFYRKGHSADGLLRSHLVVQETDLEVFTDRPVDISWLRERVRLYRRQIEGYIARDKRFLSALKPINIELAAPLIVRQMAAAAKKANVGPMAAVAGALAEFVAEDLYRKGCQEVIIENGGDIYLKTRRARNIGIYAGRKSSWQDLRLKVRPEDTPLAVCTSSGTVGHSLSFGRSDAAVILSRNGCLADALATACANMINSAEDLTRVIGFASSIRGVSGAVILFGNKLASWGKVEFSK